MQLTKNFPLRELLRSQTATRLGYEEQFNPSPAIIDNLRLEKDLITSDVLPVAEVPEEDLA